jgi:anti-sigma regulatory factor (Ser/Thr protein kinase)
LSTSLELDAVKTAPAYARSVLRAALDQWGLLRLFDHAEAITGELVANAVAASVRAAPGGSVPVPVTFWLTVRDRELCLRVRDPDPSPPPGSPSPPDDFAESGRGLVIVDALSHRWGWYPTARGGKFVWAALSLDAPLPGS